MSPPDAQVAEAVIDLGVGRCLLWRRRDAQGAGGGHPAMTYDAGRY